MCTPEFGVLNSDYFPFHHVNSLRELTMFFSCGDFRECAKILISSHAALPGGKMKAIYSKYAKEQFNCVALNRPATVPCVD
jgi:hypothetical protein